MSIDILKSCMQTPKLGKFFRKGQIKVREFWKVEVLATLSFFFFLLTANSSQSILITAIVSMCSRNNIKTIHFSFISISPNHFKKNYKHSLPFFDLRRKKKFKNMRSFLSSSFHHRNIGLVPLYIMRNFFCLHFYFIFLSMCV